MGARQSKRSVDITTTPKKGDGEIIAEGEGKLEKIGDADVKIATNGSVPHNEIETGEKEENAPAEKDQPAEVKENGLPEEESVKTPNTPDTDTSSADQLNESVVSEKTADSANESKTEETAEAKKNKEKKKKKWSFRSISFSKKDKSKPSKENKNGEVEEVAEENAEETATSPSAETPQEEVKATPEAAENSTPAAAEENSTTIEPAAEVKVEEPAKKSEEPESKPEEPKSAPVDEPKVSEPVCEKPAESAPSPVKEDVPQVEAPKVVEESITAESKEVRSDDVPPPLPSSNPPSPVTVFAESTKADALNVQAIPLMQSEPKAVEPVKEVASEPVIASATENKQTAVQEKQEIGDVKSDSILSKSEKTDSELKTVEQKTNDIVSESSDAIMSDISDAKNLSETLNNVSSIDTSETVVASSETQIKSEDTSLEAPISSEAVPEPGQPPIEEIPIDIPNPVTEKIVPELAQEQESNTDKPSEVSKETETKIEPTKDVPNPVAPVAVEKVLEEAPQSIEQVSEPAEKPVEQVSEPTQKSVEQISEPAIKQITEPSEKLVEQGSEPAEKPTEQLLETTEKLVEEILKPTESSEAVENRSDTINEASETTKETTVLLTSEPNKETPELVKESLESISTLPDISEEASGINEAVAGTTNEIYSVVGVEPLPLKDAVELTENACPLNLPKQLEADEPKNIVETETKPTNEDVIVPQETLPEPLPSSEVPLLETTEEQLSTLENSPVATNPSETLPPSPPPSPAAPLDSKPQLEESVVEPALPSPDVEPPIINAADSLPDISTESLPSLPEPFSENLAEPMSLPPVDSVPEPIAIDSPTADPPLATECPAPVHSNGEVLTNGNTNGLPSPVTEEVSSAQPKMTEGPLKQVISKDACEVRQDFGDIATESSASPAESTAVATVEE